MDPDITNDGFVATFLLLFLGLGTLFLVIFGSIITAFVVGSRRKTRIKANVSQTYQQWADSQGIRYRMWGAKPLLRGGFFNTASVLDQPRSRDIFWGQRGGWVFLTFAYEWSKPADGVLLRYQWYRRTTYVTAVYVGGSLPAMGVSTKLSLAMGLGGSPTAGKTFDDLFQVESSDRDVTEKVLDENVRRFMVSAAASRGPNTEWWLCDGWLFTARQFDAVEAPLRLRWLDEDLAFITEVARAIPAKVAGEYGMTYGAGVNPDGVVQRVFPPA